MLLTIWHVVSWVLMALGLLALYGICTPGKTERAPTREQPQRNGGPEFEDNPFEAQMDAEAYAVTLRRLRELEADAALRLHELRGDDQ